jgi:hypothetical protein
MNIFKKAIFFLLVICSCSPKHNINAGLEGATSDYIIDEPFFEDCFVIDSNYQNIPLVSVLESLVDHSIVYDPAYVTIPYPNGDVNPKTGVCTDVITRAYRKIGIDLQREVHEDMTAHFDQYPKKWELRHQTQTLTTGEFPI